MTLCICGHPKFIHEHWDIVKRHCTVCPCRRYRFSVRKTLGHLIRWGR